jgi:hypothetical protein
LGRTPAKSLRYARGVDARALQHRYLLKRPKNGA